MKSVLVIEDDWAMISPFSECNVDLVIVIFLEFMFPFPLAPITHDLISFTDPTLMIPLT